MNGRNAAWQDGVRAIAPVMLGVLPFALITGAAAASVGLNPGQGMGMAAIVFAGASQLAALQLIASHAPMLVVVLTGLVINLRFAMYSASLSPYLGEGTVRRRALIAYLITDQGYAISIGRFHAEPSDFDRFGFYCGATFLMWVVYQLGSLTGIFLGAWIPASWSLDFAIPLTFMAVIVPMIRNRSTAAAAVASALTAVAAHGLPYNLGLLTAAIVGMIVGVRTGRTHA